MDVGRQAFRQLLAISRSDGRLSPHERHLLEHYRDELGLEDDFPDLDAAPVEAGPVPRELTDTSLHERVEVVRAMLRIAHADGETCRAERRHLRKTAAALGIQRMQYAGLALEARRAAAPAWKRRLAAALAVAALLGVALVPTALRPAVAASEPAFRAALRDHRASVLLIVSEYTLVKGSERRRRRGTGTGFFVSQSGHLVTNRHVVEPWIGAGEARDLVDAGWQPEPDSVAVSAWPVGARLFATASTFDRSSCYATSAGTLRVVASPERVHVPPVQGLSRAPDETELDLVLLQADVAAPVQPLPLAAETFRPEVLDDVLVLGFPAGSTPIEGWHVEPSAVEGCVRKVEGSITISAPVEPGNSGGPVFGPRGEVLGVATSRLGSASMGKCVHVRHVRELLRRAGVR